MGAFAGRRGEKKENYRVEVSMEKNVFYLLIIQNKDRVPENVPTLWWKPSDIENVLEGSPGTRVKTHTQTRTRTHTHTHSHTHTHTQTRTQAYNRSSREKRQRTPIIEAFDAVLFTMPSGFKRNTDKNVERVF